MVLLAFESTDSSLVLNDTNCTTDVFVAPNPLLATSSDRHANTYIHVNNHSRTYSWGQCLGTDCLAVTLFTFGFGWRR